MKRVVYTVLMIFYVIFSVVTIGYAARWMETASFSLIAAKARDIAILAAKTFTVTDAEVAELKQINYKDLHHHPINVRLETMFSDADGYKDIRFAYVMVKLEDSQIKYRVTEENEQFYGAQAGTPLDLMWLADVVVGKTMDQVLADDPASYDDIRRYSYSRPSNATAFDDRKPFYSLAKDEYGTEISGMAPVYSTEGTFVGMFGVDILIDEYYNNAGLIKALLLLVLLLPSIVLSGLYILVYITNVRKAYVTAFTDPLTSIKNRRYMDKSLPQIVKDHCRKKRPLSVIMLDIDHFKAYNDNYGHQMGDKVLVEVTKAVSSVLRDKSDTICRYGGEEFLVILTDTKLADAEKIAARIKTAVNSLAIKHDHSAAADTVTISQGIYSAVPSPADNEKTFVEYADKGLYEAKETGRNKWVVYSLTAN